MWDTRLIVKVKLESQDRSRIHEVIARDITHNVKREDFVKMKEHSAPLIVLFEKFLNDAFKQGVEFRDHNRSRYFSVE